MTIHDRSGQFIMIHDLSVKEFIDSLVRFTVTNDGQRAFSAKEEVILRHIIVRYHLLNI